MSLLEAKRYNGSIRLIREAWRCHHNFLSILAFPPPPPRWIIAHFFFDFFAEGVKFRNRYGQTSLFPKFWDPRRRKRLGNVALLVRISRKTVVWRPSYARSRLKTLSGGGFPPPTPADNSSIFFDFFRTPFLEGDGGDGGDGGRILGQGQARYSNAPRD